MTNIHDELNRLTPEPDMDFLTRLDQQLQAKIEQEMTSPMIATKNNVLMFDIQRIVLLAGVFLMVLLSGLLLLTISPSPEDDLSTSIIQTTPTVAAQDNCEVESQSGWIVHFVTEDDTLETISQRYAVDSKELLDGNCITEIEVGMQLFVPAEIGYAAIVTHDYIRAGETITEAMVRRAYFADLPENVALDVDDVVGTVALRGFGPHQLFSTRGQHLQYVGYESFEINNQVYTAKEGKLLFQMRFPSTVTYEDRVLYFQGVQEGCMWMGQAQQDSFQVCANGTTLLSRNIPTGRAQVIYQGPEDFLLEASLSDAVLIVSLFASGEYRFSDNVPAHADQTLTVSLNDLPVTQEQIENGLDMTWRVTIDTCNAVLEEFLPCDDIAQVYKFEPLAIKVNQLANNPDEESLATVTLSANDAEVLKWALDNDVEILLVE